MRFRLGQFRLGQFRLGQIAFRDHDIVKRRNWDPASIAANAFFF